MASPLVAGIAALVLSENPTLTPAQVQTVLTNSCENIDAYNTGFIGELGAGRINASRTLFSINSITPSTGSINTSMTVSLDGYNFLQGMTLTLTKSTQTITASSVSIKSISLATATFSLNGVPDGRWDVTITSGARTSTLENGFGVVSSSFDVISLSPTQATTKSLSVAQGTVTISWLYCFANRLFVFT
jgi:subtilisin family serine protease